MRRLVLGTYNLGKIKEYKLLFKELSLPLQISTLKELKIEKKPKEEGKSFREIAIKKGKFFAHLTKLPTLSEDGGLEIEILGGEPGIKSKRWPGYEAEDEELIKFTLKKLEGIPFEKRNAKLKIVLCLALPYRNKTSYFLAKGEIKGKILNEPRGKLQKGYPFRVLFYLPKYKKTFAQLGFKKEVEIGHRKKALLRLKPILELLPKINFDFEFSKFTPLQRKVYQQVEKIPYGKTKTYKEIAENLSLGNSQRLIAKILSQNPLPLIIPCHRVVGKRDLGGYIFGRKMKEYLIKLEKEV